MLRKLNEDFERGILPKEFNFRKQEIIEEIDWDKVRYNTFYKENEYFLSKLPKPIRNIVGIEKIIEKMKEESLTPLEEMNLRQQE